MEDGDILVMDSWYIWLYLFCVFAVFLFFIVCFRRYLKVRNRARVLLVKEYSEAYLDLACKFDELQEQAARIPSDVCLSVSRNSLQGFRAYNPYKDAGRYASEEVNRFYLSGLPEKLAFNLSLVSEFEKFRVGLDMSESENDWRDACEKMKLPYRKWREIESRLITGMKLDARTDWKLEVRLSYVSPAGRSRHYNSWSFSADDMVCMAEKASSKQKVKSVERNKMTAKLRYQVLREDGFKCQICGRGAADGEMLEVDHIVPVSKGGLTVRENLRTLCHTCNQGKKDRYVWGELN